MSMQRITVLGATGSIGQNTLDVLARHPGRFALYALVAATSTEAMLALCAQHRPQVAVMAHRASKIGRAHV